MSQEFWSVAYVFRVISSSHCDADYDGDDDDDDDDENDGGDYNDNGKDVDDDNGYGYDGYDDDDDADDDNDTNNRSGDDDDGDDADDDDVLMYRVCIWLHTDIHHKSKYDYIATTLIRDTSMGFLSLLRYVKLRIAHAPGCRDTGNAFPATAG